MTGTLRVAQTTLAAFGESTGSGGIANRVGVQVVQDFYLYCALVGLAYQVRAGTITTPLVGDVVLTDAKAEMASLVATGTTIIPVSLNVAIRLATGTLHEYAAKSNAASTMTGGSAFVALPLRTDSSGCVSTHMVGAAGGVTVAAELDTTTRRHWEYSNPVVVGAGNDAVLSEWVPRVPPVLKGPATFYVQIAATGTGPSYYAHYDFLEFQSATLL